MSPRLEAITNAIVAWHDESSEEGMASCRALAPGAGQADPWDAGTESAIVPFRGRVVHRVDGHEPPSDGHMGAPRLACGKEFPYRIDSFGNKVFHPWRCWEVHEPPSAIQRPCPTCWPTPPEPATGQGEPS